MLKLDKIDWAEVVNALDSKEEFRDCDIKRALRKTGRSFNNNGPFHTTVRNFIKYLGNNVKIKMANGEKIYTIIQVPSTEKRPVCQQIGLDKCVPAVIASSSIVKEDVVKQKDEDKIKDLFNRSYSSLSGAIKLLAIFIKYETKKLSSEIVKSEFKTLGMNYTSFLHVGRPTSKIIFERLELFTFNIKRYGIKGSDWILLGDCEVLEAFMKLQEIYKNLTGVEHENLDDYISSKKMVVQPKTWEKAKVITKTISLEINRDETTDAKWKKWLLLEALKNRQGASSSIDSLIGWIKSTRYAEINRNEAIKLFREMQNDSGCIKFTPGDCVSYNGEETIRALFKHYDPKKITENVYVKVRMTPEEMGKTFSGMMFNIDEALGGGKYIYKIHIDRSYQMEVNLKKLLRIIQISGAVYSTSSFMISRVSKILEKEDSEKNSKEQSILILENI